MLLGVRSGTLRAAMQGREDWLGRLSGRLLPDQLLSGISVKDAAAVRELLQQTDARAPLSRSYFSPGHLTASAFVLHPEAEALALIEHPKLHLWLQPGGHFEPTDLDWVDAARRELREETGLESVQLVSDLWDVDIHRIPANSREPAHLHFDIRVLFRAETAEFRLRGEVRRAEWFAFEELSPFAQLKEAQSPLRAGEALGTDASVGRAAERLRMTAFLLKPAGESGDPSGSHRQGDSSR